MPWSRLDRRAIGTIVPSIIDAFFRELVSTIELFAEGRGYLVVLRCSHNDAMMERRALARLMSMDVAGIAPPALFTMPAVNANVIERRDAYRERMTELGYEPRILNPEDEFIGDDYERFLTLPPERLAGVSSILRPNDRVTFGLLAAAKRWACGSARMRAAICGSSRMTATLRRLRPALAHAGVEADHRIS